jgi:hypothetical protein
MKDNFGNECYGCIYKITNLMNRKCYIGQTTQEYSAYIQKHFKRAMREYDILKESKGKKYFYNAIRKYGKENFKIEILGFCHSLEELNEAEIESIWLFRSYGSDGENEDNLYGYNRTLGGYGCLANSNPGHKRKGKSLEEFYGKDKALCIESKRTKTISNRSPERKKEIHNNMGGTKHHSYGTGGNYEIWLKKFGKEVADEKQKELILKRKETFENKTEEERKEINNKISVSKTGKPNINGRGKKRTPETCRNIGKAKKGFKHSNKTKEKLKIINTGKTNGNAKKYILTSPEGKEIFLHGEFTKFCKENKLSYSGLINVIEGKRLNWKGWKCKKI